MTQTQDHTGTDRNETVLSEEDVRCLREQGDGWEHLWDRLRGSLHLRLQRMLVGGQVNDPNSWGTTARWLGDPHLAMDFIADFLMFDLTPKAQAGTLLRGYDGKATVEIYLTAPKIIRGRAFDYAAKNARRGITQMPKDWEADGGSFRSIGGEDDPEHAGTSIRPTRTGIAPDSRPLRIAWSEEGPITGLVRMAMLQCWPRIDPDQPGRERLCVDLLETIRKAGSSDPLSAIEERHRAAATRLRRKYDANTDRIINEPGMHEETRDELDQDQLSTLGKLLFEPLSTDDVAALFAIKSNTADQRNSRYRRALPKLFPQFQDDLEDSIGRS